MMRSTQLREQDDEQHRLSLQPPLRFNDSAASLAAVIHVDETYQMKKKREKRKLKDEITESLCSSLHPEEALLPMVDASSSATTTTSTTSDPDIHRAITIPGDDEHQPGAVRVRGFQHQDSPPSLPGNTDDGGGSGHQQDSSSVTDAYVTDANTAIVAELVTPVNAEVVRPEDLKQMMSSQSFKMRSRLCVGGGVSAVVVIAAAVLVIVLVVTNNNSNDSIKSNNFQRTQPPTVPSARTTLPPIAPNPCGDFPCKSNLTIKELVTNASNHTLLTEYLNRDFNKFIWDYVSSERIKRTLFAPTDESFRELQPPYRFYMEDTSAWQVHLATMLVYLVLAEPENTTQIFQSDLLQTVWSSFPIAVNKVNKTFANGASIIHADIQASNGYIQVPDRVFFNTDLSITLLEAVSLQNPKIYNSVTKFRSLLRASGLESKLEQYVETGLTLFIPDDSAFDSLDANTTAALFGTISNEAFIKYFVTYHILVFNLNSVNPGNEFTLGMLNNVSAWFTNNNPAKDSYVNTAKLSVTFILQNGYLHVINQVLVPPDVGQLLQITSNMTTDYNFTTFQTIVEGYAHLGNLFQGIIDGYHNLGNYFSGTDYLTVFAPLDKAFLLVDRDLLKRLMDSNKWLLHLQSLCLHHFTVDTFLDVQGSHTLAMLSGFPLTLEVLTAGTPITDSNQTIDGVAVESIPGAWTSFLDASDGYVLR